MFGRPLDHSQRLGPRLELCYSEKTKDCKSEHYNDSIDDLRLKVDVNRNNMDSFMQCGGHSGTFVLTNNDVYNCNDATHNYVINHESNVYNQCHTRHYNHGGFGYEYYPQLIGHNGQSHNCNGFEEPMIQLPNFMCDGEVIKPIYVYNNRQKHSHTIVINNQAGANGAKYANDEILGKICTI